MRQRTGIGYDLHPLVAGRRLVLGGVEIPYERGLLGHSDADALCHAITDALLGAAGLGDIGQHFPDTDPQYKDARSLNLLRRAVKMVWREKMGVVNVDATVIAEEPLLTPYLPKMRAAIAEVLGVEPDRVNLKATRSEGLGPLGAKQAVAALAVLTLDESSG